MFQCRHISRQLNIFWRDSGQKRYCFRWQTWFPQWSFFQQKLFFNIFLTQIKNFFFKYTQGESNKWQNLSSFSWTMLTGSSINTMNKNAKFIRFCKALLLLFGIDNLYYLFRIWYFTTNTSLATYLKWIGHNLTEFHKLHVQREQDEKKKCAVNNINDFIPTFVTVLSRWWWSGHDQEDTECR